jgi:hypothetical protein
MELDALSHFGQILMAEVRDRAINDWEETLKGERKSARSKTNFQKLSTLKPEQQEVFRQILPQIVDSVLHHLLWILEENEDIELNVKTSVGFQNIAKISDGLTGEPFGKNGWIAMYSKKDNPY